MEASLIKLLDRIPAGSKGKLLQLANVCGSKALESHAKEIVDGLLTVVGDAEKSVADRSAAAKEAVSFQPDNMDVLTAVLDQLNAQTTPELAAALIESAGMSTAEGLPTALVEKAAGLTPQMKSARDPSYARAAGDHIGSAESIEARQFELGDLTLDQKQALRSHPDAAIRKLAETLMAAGGGLPDADRDKVLKSLLEICEAEGNKVNGKAMFVKHCSRCHMHGTEGKTIVQT